MRSQANFRIMYLKELNSLAKLGWVEFPCRVLHDNQKVQMWADVRMSEASAVTKLVESCAKSCAKNAWYRINEINKQTIFRNTYSATKLVRFSRTPCSK